MKVRCRVSYFAFAFLSATAAVAQTQLSRDQLLAAGVNADRYAESQSSQRTPAPNWGTSSDSAIALPASAFTPRLGVALWDSFGSGERYRLQTIIGPSTVTTDAYFDAPVNLPQGAKITGLRVFWCDSDMASGADLNAWLETADEPSGANFVPYGNLATTGAPGCVSMFADLGANNLVIDHATKSFWVRFYIGGIGTNNRIRGALVYYRLQISPDPATQTFADVPVGHPFHRFVEALAASGITGGCGGGNYCPNDPVTRGQMAVFLAAALGLHFPN